MSVELISVLSAVLAIGATLTGVIPDSATSTVASEMPASSAFLPKTPEPIGELYFFLRSLDWPAVGCRHPHRRRCGQYH